MGEKLSIDESMHQKDLFTFLSNKDGHGKKGTLIAAIRGTKASVAARAFLDMVYLSAGNCYFDNLHPLNKTKVKQLLPLYKSKALMERVTKLLNLK